MTTRLKSCVRKSPAEWIAIANGILAAIAATPPPCTRLALAEHDRRALP